VRQRSALLFKPFVAAQSIPEEADNSENSSRSWSSQASQEVLMRPDLVSANRGLWYTPYGQCGIEEGYKGFEYLFKICNPRGF